MALRGKSRKRSHHFDIDEYTPSLPSQDILSTQEPELGPQLHTEYVELRPGVREYIDVPMLSALVDPVPAQSLANTGITSGVPGNNNDIPHLLPADFSDNDEDEIVGHDEYTLEAIGLQDTTANLPDSVKEKTQQKQSPGDHPLHTWIPHIDTYVNEFLQLEGCSPQALSTCANNHCTGTLATAVTQSQIAQFRCTDCHMSRLFCADCIVSLHSLLPFHRIQSWNGFHFERILLKTLGLRIQLGHDGGECCTNPEPAFNDDFAIIDSDGIHCVGLDYCGCVQSLPKTVQLLRSRLFLSTVVDPKTAAMFRVLETFQMLSFTSKVSVYEFYWSLVRRTDNTNTTTLLDRYQVFLRIVREWRHVRLLKRMGRGHSDSGVRGTEQGLCAVLCPACPIPGINLASGWQSDSNQWLYALFLGIDANFRLKWMNVSSEEQDPGLNHGYAYIVKTQAFKQYLEVYDERIPNDKSTCNNHNTIKSASMRGGKGTAASGLGTVECSQHNMKRPISVGDLQKGERYVNMDYFFLSSLRNNTPSSLVISYNIACQWSRNLTEHCAIYPPNEISTNEHQITFLVPKFHLPAHIMKCQINYLFNLIPGVGRTEGESPERGLVLPQSAIK